MYYINGEQIYALYAEKVEVEVNGKIEKQYVVQTENDKIRRYITKWNVTLGEEEGSPTYSTVVLPVNIKYVCNATIYWGDGEIHTAYNCQGNKTHTYEKAGTYVIKWEKPYSFGASSEGKTFKEIYLAEGINLGSCRDINTLKKLCVSSSATGNINAYWGQQLYNLKALIVGDGVTGFGTMAYAGLNWRSMEYLVANGCSICELRTMNDLKAFSCKSATTMESSRSYLYERLRYVVFDNMKEILSTAFYGGWGNYLLVADLPETLESIGNNSFLMNVKDVYLRTLTPPTLGGTSVFWNAWWGNKTTIHIRKDATYTDAEGTTYTGLEAYAHATNWATLYANTNYTFIDDL
jgi:hypothetical protein